MADRFAPRLVNGPFEDPVLFVGFHHERRAVLFDLGRIDRLSAREILKISDVFVSHTHLDHFIGFDHLLRCSLNRERELRLYGPKGIIDNVRGKLAGYTWNWIREYPIALAVHEVDPPVVRKVDLKAAGGFAPEGEAEGPFTGTLLEESSFRVRCAVLDHAVPCLAFSLEESNRLNVRPDVLQAEGLQPGPWLDELKRMLRERHPSTTLLGAPLESGKTRELSLEAWRDLLILESAGQKITYVVDNQYNAANAGRIVSLAAGSDFFFCEASFSQADEQRARERYHLTATQAGRLARRAGVKKFVPFHFSLRYRSEPDRLRDEALAAFAAGEADESAA
ncbi:MAG TPA: ribonuclease Z [candidate division Zixibacteria bacterium]|nr:ribonuclease Z [candidate division Zixibacteria bacterium]